MRSVMVFVICLIVFLASATDARSGSITVEVSGIESAEGHVSIGLFADKAGFPDKGGEFRGANVKVAGKVVVYTFQGLLPGTYAIAVFHDINSNSRIDKNPLGIPTEGYAFSNNVFGIFGTAPEFRAASIELDGDMTIEIKIKY